MILKKNNSFIKKKFLKEISFLLIISIIFNFFSLSVTPVLDRDEARYVQSSRQMIEENNYSSIKFQEDYRSKKPIGIYWLQSFLVKNTSEIEKIDNSSFKIKNDYIWKYRMVSAISSLISIIILFYLTNKLYSRNIALLASLILSSCLLFVTESHIAKTDASLLTCSITTMLILAGYYLKMFEKGNILPFLSLWSFLAFSILIKGPILFFIILVSSIFIVLIKKDIEWIKNTSPIKGIILLSLIVLPCFYILISSGQENFFKESIRNDFLGKIISAQENHSAFFGAHFLSSWLLFFPMSIFLVPAFFFIKENLSDKKVFFFVSWIIPNLIIMELIPTKLPHYTLPLYPALSILVASMLLNKNNREKVLNNFLSIIGYLFSFIVSSAAIIALSFGVYKFGKIDIVMITITVGLLILNLIPFFIIFKKKYSFLVKYLILLSAVFYMSIFFIYLPNMKNIWISKRISENIANAEAIIDSRSIYTLGYNEPSLVFEIGTNINHLKNINEFLITSINIKYLILEEKYYENFIEITRNNDIKYILINKFKGFNFAKNKEVRIYVFKMLN